MRENKQTKLSSIVKSLPGWRPHKTDQSRGLQYNNNKKQQSQQSIFVVAFNT